MASPQGAATSTTSVIPTQSSNILPLLRAYLVYGLVSALDCAPTLLDYLLNVPILRETVKNYVLNLLCTCEVPALVSLLIYSLLHSHVGGETLATMHCLRSENKDVFLGYCSRS